MTNCKLILTFICCYLCSLHTIFAQSTFQIALNKTDETIISDIVLSEDNTFLILTLSYNEIEIIKMDENATILSSFQFSKPNARFTPEPKIFKKKNGDVSLLVPENSGGVTSKIAFYALDSNLKIINSQVLPNAYPFYDWKHIQEFEDGSMMLWVSNSKNARLTIQGIKMDNSYNTIWNKEYKFDNGDDLVLRSSVNINSEAYVLVRRFDSTTGSRNYNCVIKLDHNGNVVETKALNFDPNHIDKDSRQNIIAIGTTNANQLICAKFDKDLNIIWAKEIGFAKVPYLGVEKNALQAIEKGFVIDEFDNIYVTIMEESKDEFDGTKLLKLTPNGEVSYSNLLLDGSHSRVDKVLMMNQNILMKISTAQGTIITKLTNQLASTECSSMPFCPEILDFIVIKSDDFEALSTGGPLLQNGNPLIQANTQVSFSNYCQSLDQPYADFDIIQEKWCIGESVKINLETLYPRGRSIWQLIHDEDTTLQKTKQPEPFFLLHAGKYKIIHTLIFAGCMYQDSLLFEVSAPGATILDRKLYLCPNDSLVINLASLNLTDIVWFDGDISAVKTFYNPGNVSLKYVDQNGCPNEDKINIARKNQPEIDLGDDVTICSDSVYNISLVIPNDVSVRWNNMNTNTSIIINEEGNYSATVTNVCGEATDDINVDVIDCKTVFFYPNVFSPNGDGINDYFEIIALNATDMSLKIYDRWGNLIFHNVNQPISWDGKFNNQNVQVGIYMFVVSYNKFLSGKNEIISGNVTLLR